MSLSLSPTSLLPTLLKKTSKRTFFEHSSQMLETFAINIYIGLLNACLYYIIQEKRLISHFFYGFDEDILECLVMVLSINPCCQDGQVIKLPFALYLTFVIEAQHGFNKVKPILYPQLSLCQVCNNLDGQVDIT